MLRKKSQLARHLGKFTNQGFTLIELVVVMAIIAVLATLVIGAITVAQNAARQTTDIQNAKTIQAAMEAYTARHKGTPPATIDNNGNALPGGENGWNAISFKYAAVNYLSDLMTNGNLNPTPWCPSGGWGDGGGMMNIYLNGSYTIRPADGHCNEDTMSRDAIIVNY